jgi:hypothetical protein
MQSVPRNTIDAAANATELRDLLSPTRLIGSSNKDKFQNRTKDAK